MKTMPLPDIIARLVEINKCDAKLAETFLTEFSAQIGRALSESGSLHIKELGTFRRIELGDEVTVEFAPEQSLADAVNAPFAMFEPLELDDEVTSEMLDNAAEELATVSPDDSHAATATNAPPIEPCCGETPISHEDATLPPPESLNPTDDLPKGIPPIPDCPAPAVTANETPAADETPQQPAATATHEKIIEKERVVEVHSSRHTFNIVLTAIIALLAGLLIGYFAYDRVNLRNVKSVNISADDVQVYHNVNSGNRETDTPATPATPAEPAEPAATPTPAESTAVTEAKTAVVTDTVRRNRFLTTMALQHYGKKKFWVYIYLENSQLLDDPDKIAPNTVVVIPPASKYGIRPGDAASEADAERKASEIMNRYHKND